MADTYSQIYIHTVFTVQNRRALIQADWEEEIFKNIIGIIQNKGQKMLSINGTSNHIHFFIGMKPPCVSTHKHNGIIISQMEVPSYRNIQIII